MSKDTPCDVLYDSRQLHAFIPSNLDDLGLTLEAFRIYCHLVRRAGKTREAYPSYATIGEACLRGSYPNSSKASLKAKAIAAVKELEAYGLIRKEIYDEGKNHKYNIYHLTDSSEWRSPKGFTSCNTRKGRAGMTRLSAKTTPVNGVNPPVNGVNPPEGLTGITTSVNGDNHPGYPEMTTPVNPTLPKGNPIEGNPIEGNPIEGIYVGSANANPPVRAKKSAKKKTRPGASEVYASLIEPTKFEQFWSWYLGVCKKYAGKAGDKVAAARAWTEMLESGVDYERFRTGCKFWLESLKENATGIPHGERFLVGSTKHPTPYWESAIQERESPDLSDDFLPESESKSVFHAIASELKRLNQTAQLPREWQSKTGGVIVSDLSESEAKEYLSYLRSLQEVA